MEEILASIRRIIADDQAGPAGARVTEDDVLDLAGLAKPLRRAEPVPLDGLDTDAEAHAVDFAPVARPAPAPVRETSARAEPTARPLHPSVPHRLQAVLEEQVGERLLSRTAGESVGQAFHLLSSTVLSQNARTLDDLVADMLRPMLKAWLDDNLPVMVERLVRAEIERVARGR